ncbi:hypothetical protein THAOC_21034 [Thalassiosira oceanica]|uniref:Uncharacterized protein n=1 Tax=Thalassiosira oceanica TaxID=159749 RepID=K0S0H2_THAOC|nr:hypothetical protein THAOC_21034 [Thalassiosira oceanica]|eukprot:EJK58810.1 hypothetical protein THAOC_21034 [Thalassiosira oceanica]
MEWQQVLGQLPQLHARIAHSFTGCVAYLADNSNGSVDKVVLNKLVLKKDDYCSNTDGSGNRKDGSIIRRDKSNQRPYVQYFSVNARLDAAMPDWDRSPPDDMDMMHEMERDWWLQYEFENGELEEDWKPPRARTCRGGGKRRVHSRRRRGGVRRAC